MFDPNGWLISVDRSDYDGPSLDPKIVFKTREAACLWIAKQLADCKPVKQYDVASRYTITTVALRLE
jgi:hypothetical protein